MAPSAKTTRARKLIIGRDGRMPGTDGAAIEHVNCSGLPFHSALQAAVAQGLVNRAGGRVWLSDLAEGLGEAGQQVCHGR